jgi:phospholipase C
MIRCKNSFLVALPILSGAALLALMNGCGGGSSTTNNSNPPPQSKIQHIVVIFQENRTPDNLFQDPVLIQRGADIQNYGINSKGAKVQLSAIPLAIAWDNNHAHSSFVAMYDGGKMDGADLIPPVCGTGCLPPPPDRPFNYVQASDVQPYYTLAETYAFGDRMFQTNQGPSFPAHQFIISGSSAPTPPGQPNSNLFVAENNVGPNLGATGCLAPPGQFTFLIDPANPDPNTNETQTSSLCYDHPTLTDLLDNQKISWRYYASTAGILWNGPTAIEHICGPNPAPPNATTCAGSIWQQNVVASPKQVLTDIQNAQLASMTWVTPNAQQSDHPGPNANEGPAWVASIVNAIGNSSYWANTAIIITWDDWGGWYDHVAPTVINSYEYGFRVPLLVVSPYAKAAYVSHQVNDFGSILKFVEETFSLPNVAPGATPAYADELSTGADLSDFFDFTQTPLAFHTIQAKQDASYFLRDTRPPAAPDDDD